MTIDEKFINTVYKMGFENVLDFLLCTQGEGELKNCMDDMINILKNHNNNLKN